MTDSPDESHDDLLARILAKIREHHTPPPPGSVAAMLAKQATQEQLAELFASLPPDARERIFNMFPHLRPEP